MLDGRRNGSDNRGWRGAGRSDTTAKLSREREDLVSAAAYLGEGLNRRLRTPPGNSVTDFGPQLFELRGALLQAPFVDRFNVEAPVTANLESR